MCYINDNLGINFKNSKFYKLATNEEVAPEKRLEFITIICSKNLVLKDELVEELWEIYEEKESDILIELKFAFLNKDIRTNRLCKSFLLNETDLKVLKLARRVFRNNRVRKDKKNLRILCDLKTSEEKTTFLCFLENKYQDDIEVKRSKERERKEKEQALLKAYQAFLNNKVGLAKLEESLNSSEDLTINLTRRNKNYEGRI